MAPFATSDVLHLLLEATEVSSSVPVVSLQFQVGGGRSGGHRIEILNYCLLLLLILLRRAHQKLRLLLRRYHRVVVGL